ncbi:DUF932 domain-containing protein [Aureibaculum sp. 2210JD6-5]|uniref:DUF932 domain-containing protein n=1 Tax=Aureibaculum sp. 2210JD6-5 TaxID=3103957 RepID=UPI002AAEC9A4|nr:DUF932 domain-containing protein [Aureibaculum sp. 2210JD6-5]MDY7397001.1 DUF932 domain-containing protein [Aureibaculum sp. 2210JD6-5]
MYLNNLQQDEIFIPSEMKSLQSITGIQSRRGLENVIISNGKVVNVVSNSYGHISNELFFKKAEQLLVDAKLSYHKRTINRNDRSFVIDFIIEDKNQFELKNKQDRILPMLRFKNSYDGSEKTSGHFGFYRQLCSNGLHVSQSEIAFSIRHTKNSTDLIMPNLNRLFDRFFDNEYYGITRKFREMEAIEILDTKAFVKEILERTKLFRYECSDKNDDPSKKSREVIELINDESFPTYSKPNLWVGYNAFNWMLHNTLKKSFSQQEKLDSKLFDEIYDLV